MAQAPIVSPLAARLRRPGPNGRVQVRVPATSANLGPAFDSAALALALYDDVLVEVTGSGLTIDVEGEGCATVPRDERHLLVTSLRAAFDVLGGQPAGLSVRCTNRIPHTRGLGSSSATIVAAVLAARALVDDGPARLDDAGCLRLADRLEGHPDNVAACLLGALTLAWTEPGGARAVRLEPHPELAPVVLVPQTTCPTRRVRAMLPAAVPHGDAAFNAGRAALLVHALTRAPELLMPASADLLHQPYRAPAMPTTDALVQQLRDDGVPAVVSGAGPSVLALTTTATRGVLAEVAGWRLLSLDVASRGGHVR